MDIPNIDLNGNQVALPTKEIPIIINGKEETIVLQKLTAGKRRDIAKKHFQTKMVGTQVQGQPDGPGMQIAMLSCIIKSAPFDTSEEGISNLPDEVTDYIYNEYESWSSKKKD